jgi:hypothetical protein
VDGRALLDRLNRWVLRTRPPVPTPRALLVAVHAGPLPDPDTPMPSWRPGVAAGVLDAHDVPVHKPIPVGGDPRDDPAAAQAVARFQAAYGELAVQSRIPPEPGPVLVRAPLRTLANELVAKLDPRVTIADGIRHRLAIAPWVTWQAEDPLEPVLVAPEFDLPMYEPLRDLGHHWLLPGAGSLQPDTATLVVSHQPFIEAYLAGLSHEMARELLYHEYPTDQRGTYFRQFWDVRGLLSADGTAPDPETLRDIRRIHTWNPAAGLGANTGRTPPPPAEHVVLLIKGEILRRYPNTLVYAIEATIGGDGQRTLGTAEKFPIFSGRLDPDIAFFGFDLLPDVARGPTDDADTGPEQGWYFVLAEHPTEPRFGLDADDGAYAARPTTWNDLNWAHTAASAAALTALSYLDLNADLPDTTAVAAEPDDPPLAWHADTGLGPAGANGSDLAWITLQRPFRIAIHGSDMLPETP